MSYLHLQKKWPIALSIVAHIVVLSCVNNSSNPLTQIVVPAETITVTLVEHHSREITQPVKTPALPPPVKPISAKKVTSAIKTVMQTAVPANTPATQVIEPTTVAVIESQTTQVIEPANETHIKQATEMLPAKPTVEYIPPSLSAAYLHNPEPTYPIMARRMGQQGNVLLQVTVSETGQAVVVVVLQSSGYALLDQSAVRAVKNWQFVPAKSNQQAVTAQVTVPVRFTLES